MARIRTIKPELPHSESMGKVSRDARLLFIQLWTIADDAGRARGHSRMLASLLYPYDDDARDLISGWLDELEAVGAVRRYQVDGESYLDIPNWLKHQKIDKPSASKYPAFVEPSRLFASPRELSPPDQGPRTKDQGREGIKERTTDTREDERTWERIRQVYPLGTYRESSWLTAERSFRQLVENGISTHADLLGSVEDYRRQKEATGKVGTQYVLAPNKFFADNEWRGPFPLPLTKADVRLAGNLSVAADFVKDMTQ
jgi:hypothetical protein